METVAARIARLEDQGEEGLGAAFGGAWRWKFREVLSPSQTPGEKFIEVMQYAKESLRYFDGLEFAIIDAVAAVKNRQTRSKAACGPVSF